MQVVVCFKAVPDLDKVIPTDWQDFDTRPDTSYAGIMLGCFDEAALELALRLKDQDENVTCTALTFGSLTSIQAKRLYAAGYDKVVCLDSDAVEFSPDQTAQRLVDWLRQNPAQVVFTGMRTALCDSGTVPFLMAERMGLPIISDTATCELCPEGLVVTHETEDGICTTKAALPILLAVGNSPVVGVRMATFAAQLAAGKKVVEHIAAEGVQPLPHQLLKQTPAACQFLEKDAEQAAAYLLAVANGREQA